MLSRKPVSLFLTVMILGAFASAARANLIGDTITIDHYLPSLAANGLYEAHTTVVVAGTSDFTNMIGVYVVNPEADAINVHFTYGVGQFTNHPFNGLVIGAIDDAIANVTVSTNLVGWDNSRLTFDAHAIYSNWSGLAFDNDSYFRLNITQAAAVPETASTLVLLAGAFAAVATLRRRRVA